MSVSVERPVLTTRVLVPEAETRRWHAAHDALHALKVGVGEDLYRVCSQGVDDAVR